MPHYNIVPVLHQILVSIGPFHAKGSCAEKHAYLCFNSCAMDDIEDIEDIVRGIQDQPVMDIIQTFIKCDFSGPPA